MLKTPVPPRPWRRHWRMLFLVFALLAPQLAAVRSPSAQQIVVDPGHLDGERPAACPGETFWWGTWSVGNVEVDGYYFDANPFRLTRWTTQTSGIYSSTKGLRLTDLSRTKVWTDARARATCWESVYGPIHVWWARWEGHFGSVENRDVDCDENGTSLVNGPSDPGYDPNDPGTGDCAGPGEGSGGSDASGIQFQPGQSTGGETVTWSGGVGDGGRSVCGALAVVEYVCIDVWDEEAGWVEWDCGYATTC